MLLHDFNFFTILQPIFILKNKYPSEVHRIETEDSYILEMHRIPYGLNDSPSKNRSVVLLQHGFLSGSFDYVLAGPNRSLGINVF